MFPLSFPPHLPAALPDWRESAQRLPPGLSLRDCGGQTGGVSCPLVLSCALFGSRRYVSLVRLVLAVAYAQCADPNGRLAQYLA